jgi:hypothetical protein
VYEKPALVTYLRIAEQTIAIDDTLFADLALGRRARPDLDLDEPIARAGKDSTGFFLNVSIRLRNRGLVWVPDVRASWVGYGNSGEVASEALLRHLDVRPSEPAGVLLRISDFNSRDRLSADRQEELRPFRDTRFGAKLAGFPASSEASTWAWAAAIVVIPKDGTPLWAQIAAEGNGLDEKKARAFAWVPQKGTIPVVTWISSDSGASLKRIFPDRDLVGVAE